MRLRWGFSLPLLLGAADSCLSCIVQARLVFWPEDTRRGCSQEADGALERLRHPAPPSATLACTPAPELPASLQTLLLLSGVPSQWSLRSSQRQKDPVSEDGHTREPTKHGHCHLSSSRVSGSSHRPSPCLTSQENSRNLCFFVCGMGS